MGYHVYLQHSICTSVCWHLKTQNRSGPVTADLITNVIHITINCCWALLNLFTHLPWLKLYMLVISTVIIQGSNLTLTYSLNTSWFHWLQVQNKSTRIILWVIIIKQTLNRYLISVNFLFHSIIISLLSYFLQ